LAVDAVVHIAEVTVHLVVQVEAVVLTRVTGAPQRPVKVLLEALELEVGHKQVQRPEAAEARVDQGRLETLVTEMEVLAER
jgi:hypothetical protein